MLVLCACAASENQAFACSVHAPYLKANYTEPISVRATAKVADRA